MVDCLPSGSELGVVSRTINGFSRTVLCKEGQAMVTIRPEYKDSMTTALSTGLFILPYLDPKGRVYTDLPKRV